MSQENCSKAEQVRIFSIGVNDSGQSVVRIVFNDGRIRDIETNLKSFAMLAAEGVRVKNGG